MNGKVLCSVKYCVHYDEKTKACSFLQSMSEFDVNNEEDNNCPGFIIEEER